VDGASLAMLRHLLCKYVSYTYIIKSKINKNISCDVTSV
jgi:hypothetical protein